LNLTGGVAGIISQTKNNIRIENTSVSNPDQLGINLMNSTGSLSNVQISDTDLDNGGNGRGLLVNGGVFTADNLRITNTGDNSVDVRDGAILTLTNSMINTSRFNSTIVVTNGSTLNM